MHKTLPKYTTGDLFQQFNEERRGVVEKLLKGEINAEEGRLLLACAMALLKEAVTMIIVAEREAKLLEYKEDH